MTKKLQKRTEESQICWVTESPGAKKEPIESKKSRTGESKGVVGAAPIATGEGRRKKRVEKKGRACGRVGGHRKKAARERSARPGV